MIHIQDYTDKSIVVLGDTKPHCKMLKQLGGRYNPNLTIDGEKIVGWVFKATSRHAVQEYIDGGCKTLEERVKDLETIVKRLQSCLDQE